MTYSSEARFYLLQIYNLLHESYTSNKIREILCKKYNVSLSTIYLWISEYNFQDINIKKFVENYKKYKTYKKYKNIKITKEIESFIIDTIIANNQYSAKKLKILVKNKFNVCLSLPTIYHILHVNNYSYKKAQRKVMPYTDKELENKKINLNNTITKITRKNIISIDQMAVYIDEKSNNGWSKIGEKCIVKAKKIKGKRYTLCMAMSNKKIIHYNLCEASMDSNKFNIFVTDLIKKINTEKKSLFLDNATIHKNKKLKEIIKEKKLNVVYNIAYKSEFNPIEYVNNMIRNRLHNNENGTIEELHKIIKNFCKENNKEKFNNIYNYSFNLLSTI
jgi:transposase